MVVETGDIVVKAFEEAIPAMVTRSAMYFDVDGVLFSREDAIFNIISIFFRYRYHWSKRLEVVSKDNLTLALVDAAMLFVLCS